MSLGPSHMEKKEERGKAETPGALRKAKAETPGAVRQGKAETREALRKSKVEAQGAVRQGKVETRETLRRQYMEARQAVPAAEREAWGLRAQQALVESEWFSQADTVMLYLPIRGEVGTSLLVESALAAGKRLVLPRVQKEPRRLWLHLWSGAEEELVAGAYGIREPDAALATVEPAEVGLVVVPGVAFDRQGNRLGYGGGYYDRTLPSIRSGNPAARFVGLAYALQLVEEIPAEEHDVRLDGIATEEGLIAG